MGAIRGVLTAGAVAGLLLAGATAASAKIAVERVVVTGPGLSSPIRLGMDDAWTFLVGGGSGPESPPAPYTPRGDLGPRYTVAVAIQPGGRWTLDLHPFAPDGPVMRIGHVQEIRWLIEWGERPGHTGWVRVSDRQLAVLHPRGLPEAPPAPRASPEASPEATVATVAAVATAPAGDGGVPVPGIVAVAFAGVVVAGLVVIRRRFPGTAKPTD